MLFNSDRSSRNINVCLYIHISLCQVCLDLSFLISLTRLSLLEHISLVKHAQLREHCTTDQHGWIGDLRSQCWDSGMLYIKIAGELPAFYTLKNFTNSFLPFGVRSNWRKHIWELSRVAKCLKIFFGKLLDSYFGPKCIAIGIGLLSCCLLLLFNVLVNKISWTDRWTHNIFIPWAPVGAKNNWNSL